MNKGVMVLQRLSRFVGQGVASSYGAEVFVSMG
jgi:hypothetical protein